MARLQAQFEGAQLSEAELEVEFEKATEAFQAQQTQLETAKQNTTLPLVKAPVLKKRVALARGEVVTVLDQNHKVFRPCHHGHPLHISLPSGFSEVRIFH